MASLKPKGGRVPDSAAIKLTKRVIDVGLHKVIPACGVAVLAAAAVRVQQLHASGELAALLDSLRTTEVAFSALGLLAAAALAGAALLALAALRAARRTTYLVDYVVARPDDSWRHSRLDADAFAARSGNFTPECTDFMRKVLWFGGLGNETYLPPWICSVPQDTGMEKARLEFELIVIESARQLLAKAGVRPTEVGVLVVNCSLFCPTPSLAATLINKLQMGKNVLSYNLGGMGCSASPIAVDLGRRMLDMTPNTYALVVSNENITQNMYLGTQRSMLIPNVLFRVGGAAMLLSNRAADARRAKYVLERVVRTNLAADDVAYNCVMEQEDADGKRGVKLSKELMAVAGRALNANFTSLGPALLPLSEQLVFAAINLVGRKLLRLKGLKPYVPDFQAAAQHICIHTGGRGVVDAIQAELGLTKAFVEPSRAALYRYGNVSSASVWYVLAFIEHFRGVRKGDRVLQLAFGSGFKCNSAVWRANRTFSEQTYAWEGFDVDAMYADLATLEVKLNALVAEIKTKDGGVATERAVAAAAAEKRKLAAAAAAAAAAGSSGGSSGGGGGGGGDDLNRSGSLIKAGGNR